MDETRREKEKEMQQRLYKLRSKIKAASYRLGEGPFHEKLRLRFCFRVDLCVGQQLHCGCLLLLGTVCFSRVHLF